MTISPVIRFIVLSFLLFNACGAGTDNSSDSRDHGTNENFAGIEVSVPKYENAHPKAKELLKDSFFFSPIDESAPFGSDDGFDAVMDFLKWRSVNKMANTAYFIEDETKEWNYSYFDYTKLNEDDVKSYIASSFIGFSMLSGIDEAIIAAAFGQLYLEGTIDKDLNKLALMSIDREMFPECLLHWGALKNERIANLNKLRMVLNRFSH